MSNATKWLTLVLFAGLLMAAITVFPGGTGRVSADSGSLTFCPDSLHHVNRIHGHYNERFDCYYDHTHIAPNEAYPSRLFNRIVGQSLSYPWLTGGGSENLMWPDGKHEAYNFHSGQVDSTWNIENSESAAMQFEVEWHGMSNNMGMRTRFHSFYAIIYPSNGLSDSYIAWGGWMDCGQQVTIDGTQNWYTVDTSRPQPTGTALKHTQIGNNGQTWYCQLPDLPIENLVGQQYGFQMGRTTPENLFSMLDAYCGPDDGAECVSRGQYQEVALLLFDISTPWTDFLDPDGNGWVEHYEAWTDRYGNIRGEGECKSRALDCVPLVIHNVERLRYWAQGNVFHRSITDTPQMLNWWNR